MTDDKAARTTHGQPRAHPQSIRVLLGAAMLLAATVAASSAAETRSLILTDGTRSATQLHEITEDGHFVFYEDGKPLNVAADRIVRYGAFHDTDRGPLVFTSDGSVWVASDLVFGASLTIADEQMNFDTDTFGPMKIPLDQVRGIVFQVPESDRRRDRIFDQIRRSRDTTDVVILDNGDRLPGLTLALDDVFLSLQSDQSKVKVKVDKVTAVIFNPSLLTTPTADGPRVSVGLSDGSRLVVKSWSAGLGGPAFTTVGGLEVVKKKIDAVEVCAVQPLDGPVSYLSDIKATRYRHRPYLSLEWPYRRDRNVTDGRLRGGGKLYEKGLGVHSTAALTYNLDGLFTRFETEAVIDDSTDGHGSVVVRVYTDDGSGKWRQRFTSEIIRGGDPPQPISVDVTDAKRLSVIVDIADRGDELDHANLLDARLLP